MYEWYQEKYVGAAHGLAGIYYFLMQVRKKRHDKGKGQKSANSNDRVSTGHLLCLLQPGLVAYEEHVHQLVKPSVDYVCRLRFPLGNYPPCVGDERDLLVHWCHGAPGVVFMLLQAYKVRVLICYKNQ